MEVLIADCEGKCDTFSEEEFCGLFRAIKAKSIPIYQDNERVGIGLYPYLADMENSSNANVECHFDGHRAMVFASRAIEEGEELTVGLLLWWWWRVTNVK